MLKKYIIFGSVVLLLAALFTLTGCSQATDSNGGTQAFSENHLFGTAYADDVDRAVDSAKRTGRSVVLANGTRLTGSAGLPAVADFKDLPVRVEGSVTVQDGIIVNAAFANLTFTEGSRITVKNRGAFIYQGNDNYIATDNASAGFKVKYVTDPLTGTQGTDLHVAVSNYQVGANYNDIAPHITNFYVLENLTIDAGSTAAPTAGGPRPGSNPRIIALGEVDLAANNSLIFANLYNFQFTTSTVLTSKVPALTLTLGEATAELPTIEAAVPITIAGAPATTSLTIGGIKGPDTVTISATSIDTLVLKEVFDTGKVVVNIPTLGSNPAGTSIYKNAGSVTLVASTALNGPIAIGNALTGDGNAGIINISVEPVAFPVTVSTVNSGTINFDAGTIDPAGIVTIAKNTGELNFTKHLILGAADYLIRVPANDGAINFYGTLTTNNALGDSGTGILNLARNIAGSGTVVFGGDVDFAAATNIDCNVEFNAEVTAALALGFGGNVTLANEQVITLSAATAVTTLKGGKKLLVGNIPVLAGGRNGAAITPGVGTTLTAGRARTSDDDAEFVGDKTLTVGGVDITGIAGDLRIAGTGLLRSDVDIASGASPTGGTLTLEEGAILQLPSVGSVTIDGSTIEGAGVITSTADSATRLTASGGAVSLGPNKISGSGSTLLVPEDIAGPNITVDGDPLILAGVNLNLLYGGSLIIATGSGTGNSVILEAGAAPGKITLGEDTPNTITSLGGKKLHSDDPTSDDAVLTGSGILRGDSETLSSFIGDLSGAPTGRLTITGTTSADVTINAGASVQEP